MMFTLMTQLHSELKLGKNYNLGTTHCMVQRAEIIFRADELPRRTYLHFKLLFFTLSLIVAQCCLTCYVHNCTTKCNNITSLFFSSVGRYVKSLWKDVQVGDIVHLSCNEAIPADMVVLKSSDENNGLCYIDTQNLDGEANLKQRQVPRGMVDEVRKDTMPIIWAQSFTSIDGRSSLRHKQRFCI